MKQNSNEPDDKIITPEVIEALRNGDHAAFKKVYIHYRMPLFSFIRRLVGEAEKADGMVQDIFADLWEKRERLDPEKNIKSYLFVIARRTAFKQLFKKEVLEEYTSLDEDSIPEYTGVEDLLEARETQLIIDLAVANMPKQRREVFVLHRDGYDIDHIAKELNMKKENVYNHLTRARKEIREVIGLLAFFLLAGQ